MARTYYDVKGVDFVVDGGSADSKPNVNIKLLITKGPHAGEARYYRGYLTEASAEHTLKALKALGWVGPELDNKEGFGTILAVAVEDEENWVRDDGTTSTSRRIKWINEYRARAMKAKNEAPKDFLKQFKALAKSIPAPVTRIAAPEVVEAAPKAPPDQDPNNGLETDLIPF